MSTYKQKKQNQQKNSTKSHPSRLEDIETIATEIDAICRRRLPDGVIRGGILKGLEADIRQEALIITAGGFLQQNPGYMHARKAQDSNAATQAMERCVALTLRYSKSRIARQHCDHQRRHTQLNEANGGSCQHPSWLEPTDWPADLKAWVVKTSVNQAVRNGKLSRSNADIVAMVCDRGLRASQVAKLEKITPSAVHQQLRRVRGAIPDLVEQVEAI